MGLSALLDSHEEKDKISYRITNGMEVCRDLANCTDGAPPLTFF